jgi:hypothetical protein
LGLLPHDPDRAERRDDAFRLAAEAESAHHPSGGQVDRDDATGAEDRDPQQLPVVRRPQRGFAHGDADRLVAGSCPSDDRTTAGVDRPDLAGGRHHADWLEGLEALGARRGRRGQSLPMRTAAGASARDRNRQTKDPDPAHGRSIATALFARGERDWTVICNVVIM